MRRFRWRAWLSRWIAVAALASTGACIVDIPDPPEAAGTSSGAGAGSSSTGAGAACTVGACVGDGCIPRTATLDGSTRIGAVAVDATHVYVNNRDNNRIYRVAKADLDASGGAEFAEFATGGAIADIAADADAVYWVSTTGVFSKQKVGGATTTISGSPDVPGWRLAIAGSTVYWVQNTASLGCLHAAQADGSSLQAFLSEEASCLDLVVDAADVYVLANSGNELWRVPRDEATPELIKVVDKGRAIELDDTHLYVTSENGAVLRIDKAAPYATSAQWPMVHPYDIAVAPGADPTTLFVTTADPSHEIQGVMGNQSFPVADSIDTEPPRRIAVDDENVYWTTEDDPTLRWVLRCPSPPP